MKKIYLSSPHMCGEEMNYIQEVFDTNWIAPLGKNVDEFETEVRKYIGRKYAVAFSSGTAAIHLGLMALGVKQGDAVFCSSLTFSGSCNPIAYLKANPVFIDSDYESFNMSPVALRKAYRDFPNPKALIIVNLYGQPAEYSELLEIAKEHGTPVLEDAAESLGASYKGVKCGNFGKISILSFNGNKIITTSGGGMLLTDDEFVAYKVKFWATQSREKFLHYEHKEIGYNYRLSNICAGIGRGQMKALDNRVAKKKQIYETYKEAFKDISDIEMMSKISRGEPNYWLSVMTIKGGNVNPIDVIAALDRENIESRPVWKPMHLQPVFSDCKFFSAIDKGSVAEDLYNRGVCLPSDTKMNDEEQAKVIEIIRKLFIGKN